MGGGRGTTVKTFPVTGAAGFTGAALTRHFHTIHPDSRIIVPGTRIAVVTGNRELH